MLKLNDNAIKYGLVIINYANYDSLHPTICCKEIIKINRMELRMWMIRHGLQQIVHNLES